MIYVHNERIQTNDGIKTYAIRILEKDNIEITNFNDITKGNTTQKTKLASIQAKI